MGEPSLESISDYNSLSREKRKAIWAVILSGLIMGSIYTIVSFKYNTPDDKIQLNETFKQVSIR